MLGIIKRGCTSIAGLASSRAINSWAPKFSANAKKINASYAIYGREVALSMKPVPPVLAAKGNNNNLAILRAGGILFDIAPASGTKSYDWLKKETFRLNPTECGEFLALHAVPSVSEIEFLRGPNENNKRINRFSKRLNLKTNPDGNGVLLSLHVSGSTDLFKSMTLSISRGEFEVMRNLINYSLPRFFGFDSSWSSNISIIPSAETKISAVEE